MSSNTNDIKCFSVRLPRELYNKVLELRGEWMLRNGKDMSNTEVMQRLVKQTERIE